MSVKLFVQQWDSWKALRGHFEKSTMSNRIRARRQLYDVSHDPSQPMASYVQAVLSARTVLKNLGYNPTDTEVGVILLMNLHHSYDSVRTTILTAASEPDLTKIKSILLSTSASTDVFVKSEPANLAHAAHHGHRGYARTSGSSSGVGVIDEKGFRWCDPTNNEHCHRCGRPNHIAARCIHDMPQHIKNWVMQSPSSRSTAPRESASVAASASLTTATSSNDVTYEPTIYTSEDEEPVGIMLHT